MLRKTLVLLLLATVFVFGQSLADVGTADHDSIAHTFTLFLHQLLLVYWLGPDIAVFIWSRSAVNPGLGPEQRVAAGRMMNAIDLVPRVCLALFVTVAGVLSDTYGIAHPWWQMVGIVLLGPVWLFLVLAAWIKDGTDFGRTMAKYDRWLRMLLVVGIPASVVYSSVTGRLADTPWITGKLMMLAGVILLGLLMRMRFQAFFDGVEKMAADGPSPEIDEQMAYSLKRTRPFVHSIWLLLLLAALLGVVKPGEPDAQSAVAQAEAPLLR